MSKEILSKLKQAKEEVIRLEKLYRETCECNERISDIKEVPSNSYQRMHKTCDYHTVRLMYHAKV
jgi:hypothetical protein